MATEAISALSDAHKALEDRDTTEHRLNALIAAGERLSNFHNVYTETSKARLTAAEAEAINTVRKAIHREIEPLATEAKAKAEAAARRLAELQADLVVAAQATNRYFLNHSKGIAPALGGGPSLAKTIEQIQSQSTEEARWRALTSLIDEYSSISP